MTDTFFDEGEVNRTFSLATTQYLKRGQCPIVGQGNPNTLEVRSNFSQMYIDQTANKFYYNPNYNATSGWVALN